MGEIDQVKGTKSNAAIAPASSPSEWSPQPTMAVEQKKTFLQRVREPGSVWQIIIAALLAIAIGLIVTTQVDEVPEACVAILAIPGNLWLRALRAVGKYLKRTRVPLNFLIIISTPYDSHCHDHGDSAPTEHGSRGRQGWQTCSLDDRVLRCHDNHCRCSLLPARWSRLEQADERSQW